MSSAAVVICALRVKLGSNVQDDVGNPHFNLCLVRSRSLLEVKVLKVISIPVKLMMRICRTLNIKQHQTMCTGKKDIFFLIIYQQFNP